MPSASITAQSVGFKVTPIDKSAEKKADYGAVVTGLDLNNISGL